MSPSEALDQQRALIDYLATEQYGRYAHGMLESQNATARSVRFVNPRTGKADGPAWCYGEQSRLRTAETFYVAADMVPLVEAAARGLDITDHFEHDLWPAEAGFCWFARPLYMTDLRGRRTSIRAISWSRRLPDNQRDSPGTLVTEYADLDDPKDEISVQTWADGLGDGLRTGMGRLQMFALAWCPDGGRVGPVEVPMTDEEVEEYARQHAEANQGYSEDLDRQFPIIRRSDNTQRFYLALILLLGQEVTRTEQVNAERPVARRARRIGLPPRVTVITLRRTVEDDTEYVGPRSVEWSRRWLVRGKWQWRHCGPEHPLAEPYEKGYRARVFVRGHVKGPADKPLIVTDRVYALRR